MNIESLEQNTIYFKCQNVEKDLAKKLNKNVFVNIDNSRTLGKKKK